MTLAAKHQLEAIGTSWSIETPTPLSDKERQRIAADVAAFSDAYSRFDQQSTVSRAARQAGSFAFPDSIIPMMALYQTLYAATKGKVNPLIGASLEQLGYDQSYSLKPRGAAIPAPSLDTVQVQGSVLTFRTPALLDIGAIGKGHLIDHIATSIGARHSTYVVDGSGDMAVHVATPQTIGLEHPADSTRIIGIINLSQGALAASAPNRRTWGNGLHHIIDATTGAPANTGGVATWVGADSALLADGLASALFFAAPDTLQRYVGDFQYVIMREDGAVWHNITTIGEIYA